jgi:MFS family permease
MHPSEIPSPSSIPDSGIPWYRELNRYHWFVLVVAALGWLFDTMDQQLFNLARGPALNELTGSPLGAKEYGGIVTAIFIVGWATGGVFFGVLGDRIGRAKTMVITILIYSLFTGLSAISQNVWDFAFYRFLTGLGVGGEFAVGVSLVAEVMPERARPHALGWLQACSAFGNISAALVSMALSPLETAGMLGEWKPWRYMFIVGALPAMLALLIRRKLKEPERWVQAKASGQQKLGSYRELFGHPTWRKHAIVGLVLASSGVIGLWGIGFFSFDLVRSVFRETFEARAIEANEDAWDRDFVRFLVHRPGALGEDAKKIQPDFLIDPNAKAILKTIRALEKKKVTITSKAVLESLSKDQTADAASRRAEILAPPSSDSPDANELPGKIDSRNKRIAGDLTMWAGINGLLFNLGAFFGIYAFSKITHFIGRKPTFAVTLLLALAATAFAFWNLKQFSDVFWMVPIMGFFQIALFGGYAIYFPELFPTHLRSTGTSFCYNVGRYIAALGPLTLSWLATTVYGHHGEVGSWRYAGVSMCVFFLVGLFALPFAPETRGKPLPE